MITFKQKGDFLKTKRYLKKIKNLSVYDILDKYGREGVAALSSATPVDTGKTADLWDYLIESKKGSYVISFLNNNTNRGVKIAIILQFGHGTGTGGWVEGRDYINPAIQPVFDKIADEAWKEVTKA